MTGAFRATRLLQDGRNRFSKVIKISQTQKRNTRNRMKIIQENAAILREGREALDRVNARIIAEHRAAAVAAAKSAADTGDTGVVVSAEILQGRAPARENGHIREVQ